MATYYSSSSQRDATSTTYFPGSYLEAPALSTNMMMYMTSGSYMDIFAGNSQQQSHPVEIPAAETTDSDSQQQDLTSLGGSRIWGHDINAWRDGRNQVLVMHTQEDPSSIINGGGQNLHSQGLSLSLGTEIQPGVLMASVQYRDPNAGGLCSLNANTSIMRNADDCNGSSRDDQTRADGVLLPGYSVGNNDLSKVGVSQYGMTSITRTILSSKYLKAAQELLDEVASVLKTLKQPGNDKNQDANEHGRDGEDKSRDVPLDPQESAKTNSELSHFERQELQDKLTKLLSMLDEVDRRYKQYYHQMRIVRSSFDTVAGCGAAKPYTALALQTIFCHFRCLRDTINGQILATHKSLGEQETSDGSKAVGITCLRYVDQQLRQQRAFQQFGMMQQPAWRPQRVFLKAQFQFSVLGSSSIFFTLT